ncbi:hypothetical protein FHG87_017674 [Trinorchestia longiramus]|nr:hypothetical protein FHG87_017674 [Trinorchestia longiramus]
MGCDKSYFPQAVVGAVLGPVLGAVTRVVVVLCYFARAAVGAVTRTVTGAVTGAVARGGLSSNSDIFDPCLKTFVVYQVKKKYDRTLDWLRPPDNQALIYDWRDTKAAWKAQEIGDERFVRAYVEYDNMGPFEDFYDYTPDLSVALMDNSIRSLFYTGLKLQEQRKLQGQFSQTYKFLNGLNDITLEGLFDRRNSVRTRNKRPRTDKKLQDIPGQLKLPKF